jgi:biopolymer transport protein ExbB
MASGLSLTLLGTSPMGMLPENHRRGWGRLALVGLFVLFLSLAVIPTWQPAHAQTETTTEGDAGTADSSPNLLKHIIRSAGVFFGPLLLLMSIGLVSLIVLLALDLRMSAAIPPDFVDQFADIITKKKFKEAFEMARADNSFLGRVLTAGMGRLQYGIEDAREVVFNTVESIKANKDQLITYLATIGTLGPMIGLVGTVQGMIISFMVLGRGGSPNAAELASGISHALVLTLLGVALSVPAIFCHAFFRNRLTRITMDTANIADDLLTQMYHISRRPTAAASAGAAATPVAASVVPGKPA